MIVSGGSWEVQGAIYAAWHRLPPEVRDYLDDVTFTYQRHARKSYASAGEWDIDVNEVTSDAEANIGIVIHEICHVVANHPQRVASGELTETQAEREADELARRYGFGAELERRRRAIGR